MIKKKTALLAITCAAFALCVVWLFVAIIFGKSSRKEYYPNGQMKSCYEYVTDKNGSELKDGKCIEYYPDGKLKGFVYYSRGQGDVTKPTELYFVNGSPCTKSSKGEVIIYFPNGQVKFRIIRDQYDQWKREVVQYAANGLVLVRLTVTGKGSGIAVYDPSGSKPREYHLRDDNIEYLIYGDERLSIIDLNGQGKALSKELVEKLQEDVVVGRGMASISDDVPSFAEAWLRSENERLSQQ